MLRPDFRLLLAVVAALCHRLESRSRGRDAAVRLGRRCLFLLDVDHLVKVPPVGGSAREDHRVHLVATANNAVLAQEGQAAQRELPESDRTLHRLRSSEVHNLQRRVLAAVRQGITAGRPADALHPALAIELGIHLPERHHFGKRTALLLGVDAGDKGGDHAALEVRRSRSDELRGRVPAQAGHGGLMLLDHLRDPPVVLLLVVTDGNALRPAGHRELHAIGGPLDIQGRSVDPQDHKRGLPPLLLRVPRPHERVPVVRGRHDLVGVRTPVDPADLQVMLVQVGNLRPRGRLVDLHAVVIGRDRKT
mmetsp:Transcript_1856/g.8268  ORF Transcript_1856/g.8268 Transcript_1856/m.8268 type:complete len:306 (-) Transcript_1856:185-1102(-)